MGILSATEIARLRRVLYKYHAGCVIESHLSRVGAVGDFVDRWYFRNRSLDLMEMESHNCLSYFMKAIVANSLELLPPERAEALALGIRNLECPRRYRTDTPDPLDIDDVIRSYVFMNPLKAIPLAMSSTHDKRLLVPTEHMFKLNPLVIEWPDLSPNKIEPHQLLRETKAMPRDQERDGWLWVKDKAFALGQEQLDRMIWDLRRWGYMFWDSARLARSGANVLLESY
ncbi:hypothetical protein QBC44DRAFT_17944 [Cladorrhinum sp. PSN332]|nr:hypothetical protein QBC44DRAFT_17944 [Cladorrhinum sp. PSN332]